MQCKKCGTEIKEGCLFCHNCGEAVQIVPDYEPEMDELQIRLAMAQSKLPNKPTIQQLEEKTEESIELLKKMNWKLITIIAVVVLSIAAFTISYRSVLKKQDPGAMQQTVFPEADSNKIYVSKPKFSLPAGTYSYYVSLELTSEVEGTIYYTLDGSTPTENSYRYTAPIDLLKGTTVVRAFVVEKDGNSSDIESEVFEIEFGAPDKPTIIPESGEYIGETYVKILVPEDSICYYTLDGSMPTESSEIYTGEFLMPEGTTTVKAVVFDEHQMVSELSSVEYHCTYPGEL